MSLTSCVKSWAVCRPHAAENLGAAPVQLAMHGTHACEPRAVRAGDLALGQRGGHDADRQVHVQRRPRGGGGRVPRLRPLLLQRAQRAGARVCAAERARAQLGARGARGRGHGAGPRVRRHGQGGRARAAAAAAQHRGVQRGARRAGRARARHRVCRHLRRCAPPRGCACGPLVLQPPSARVQPPPLRRR